MKLLKILFYVIVFPVVYFKGITLIIKEPKKHSLYAKEKIGLKSK